MPEVWNADEALDHNARKGTGLVIVKTSLSPANIPRLTYRDEILPEAVEDTATEHRIFEIDGPASFMRQHTLQGMRASLMTGKTPKGVIMMIQADDNYGPDLKPANGTCLNEFDHARRVIEDGPFAEEISRMVLPVAIVSPNAHARAPGGPGRYKTGKTAELLRDLQARGIPALRTTPEMMSLEQYIDDMRAFFNGVARGVLEKCV